MKKLYIFTALVILLLVPVENVAAQPYDGPYMSYLYDPWEKSVAAPQCYLPEKTLSGSELGCGPLNNPQDVFVSEDGRIFIADCGNGRVLELDKSFVFVKEYAVLEQDGEPVSLKEPTGICVSETKMYIADKSGQVYVTDRSGNIEQIIAEPKHNLIADDFIFMPTRVVVDKAGRIYVLSYGCYYGLLQFDPMGVFMGYYGANPVEMTPDAYLDYMWKQILSQEQRETMARLLPVEYSSMAIDKEGFIFTTTISADTRTYQIKKLNPVGNNILKGKSGRELIYGDLEYDLNRDTQVYSAFIDVAADQDGIIFGLDRTRKKVFLYDPEGEMLGVFGGQGNQKGTFQQPSAIETMGNKVLVLDGSKNNLTLFQQTEYMICIREGLRALNSGDYDAASEPFSEAARRSMSNLTAHVGIGKALMRNDEYREALAEFKMGDNRYHYSDAFQQYRLETLRGTLPAAAAILLLLVFLIIAVKIARRIHIAVKERSA